MIESERDPSSEQRAVWVHSASALAAVLDPRVALAWWPRSLRAETRAELARLSELHQLDYHFTLRLTHPEHALRALEWMPHGPARELLVDDLATLVPLLARWTDSNAVRVRLRTLSSDQRDDHVATTGLGIVCGYVGSAAEHAAPSCDARERSPVVLRARAGHVMAMRTGRLGQAVSLRGVRPAKRLVLELGERFASC